MSLSKQFTIATIAALLTTSSYAHSAESEPNPLYIGVEYGNTALDPQGTYGISRLISGWGVGAITEKNSDQTFRVFLASPLSNYAAIEIGYMNGGSYSASGTSTIPLSNNGTYPVGPVYATAGVTIYDLSLAFNYNLRGRVDLFGKVGAYNSVVTTSGTKPYATAGTYSADRTAYGYLAGLGLDISVTDAASIRLARTVYANVEMNQHVHLNMATTSANFLYEF